MSSNGIDDFDDVSVDNFGGVRKRGDSGWRLGVADGSGFIRFEKRAVTFYDADE